ncbi:MAG: PAS domain S-box protein [Rhodospirillaceae bacterium]|nr:PAS domain S-box protein [Rhodospirillaceae bacterium]
MNVTNLTEQQFQYAIDNIDVGFVLWDNKQKLVSWNVQFLKFNPEFEGKLKKGMTFEELIRINSRGPIVNVSKEKRESWIQDRINEHQAETEVVFENKRSDGRWVRRFKKKLPDGSVIVMVTDITEIREQEETARLSKERYQNLVTNQQELITQFDADGTFIFVNQAYCQFVGKGEEQLLGHSLYDAVPENEIENLKEYFAAFSVDQPHNTIENKISRSDGELRIFEWSNSALFNEEDKIVEIQSVGRDITDRKLAQLALSKSEEQYRSLVDFSPEAIMLVDASGLIKYLNIGAVNLFGAKAPEDLLKKNYINFVHPKFHDLAQEKKAERLKTGVSNFTELDYVQFNGDTICCDVAGATVLWEGSAAALLILRDVTKRREIEKLKSEFLSVVTHELRTPLTSIVGSLGLVLGGVFGELPSKAIEILNVANSNSDRLIALINDILDVEKLQSDDTEFEFKKIDLVEVVSEAVELNRGFAEQCDVSFELSTSPDSTFIRADRNRVIQVISNLLSNAAKFSPAGSSVDIAVYDKAGTVRFEVSDTGPGIPEKYREKIFDRFSQIDSSDKRSVPGTGLGLNISKAIIERHNGSIDFVPRNGGGTTFFFDLPIA